MDYNTLPVNQNKDRILEALTRHQVIVVESPTGSGKTTQLPQILYDAGYAANGMIGVTQPRRIAAVSVSGFIARQRGVTIPELVGYKMRFEDVTDARTKIKIMTDGILLQEIKTDYVMSPYSVIIVDEAHERSLNIDFILGLLKRVLEMRNDFKVIISSATINASVFSQYFADCPIVHIDTPMYPVAVVYDPVDESLRDEAIVAKIGEIVQARTVDKDDGDILIFLSGEKAIKDCVGLLRELDTKRKLVLLPLYGRLSKEEQERIFIPTPPGQCKVVVATNIAETSVTIDGVVTVVDSGFAKMNYYNPKTFTSSLIEGPVSRASCDQRKGRAGRTQPGVCYRLYPKQSYLERPSYSTEEIYRTDLSEVVLRMAEIGIREFESFDFISPPGRPGIVSAVETLGLLEAIDADRNLTVIGNLMVKFPLLPRHSRIVVEAILRYPDVMEEVLVAVAFLSTNSPFLLPHGEEMQARKAHHSFSDEMGDFVSYLKIFGAWREAKDKTKFCDRFYFDERIMSEIENIKGQLEEIVGELGVPISNGGPLEDYLCSIAKGMIQFVCSRSGDTVYQSLTAEKIQIHPGSVMYRETPRFIVAGEIVKTTRMYARSVSPLKQEWLSRISAELSRSLSEGRNRKGRPDSERPEEERQERGRKERGRKEPGREEANQKQRDFTWQVQIGPEIFALKPWRGKKKIAVLEWERFSKAIEGFDTASRPGLKTMRGKILFQNHELLSGHHLGVIIRLAPFLKLDKGILSPWPKNREFTAADLGKDFGPYIEAIGRPIRAKKESRQLCFLSLNALGEGRYRFRAHQEFAASVSESLAALEALADEVSGAGNNGAEAGAAPNADASTNSRLVEKLSNVYGELRKLYEDII